tara:strand:+ start:1175 stop:1450 length:276 start_codon:yes stop_codon:yes gene_type:complete
MSRREARKLKNEQEIIDTAILPFINHRADKTTIANIINRSSFARGTFYNYFKDQSEIWDKIIQDLIVKLNNRAFKKHLSLQPFIFLSTIHF